MKYSFDCVYGDNMCNFINEKRALGYKYETEEYILHKFNDYWKENNGDNTEISPATLDGWLARRCNECTTTQANRIQTVRQFLRYLSGLGISTYIPNLKYKKNHKVAYILSKEEIKELFKIIDKYDPIGRCPAVHRMAKEYKVLFRLLLVTGLRRGEAAKLTFKDISFADRTIKILDAKNHKDRIIYCSEDMLTLIKAYKKYLGATDAACSPWVFPSLKPDKHIPLDSISIRFHKFWVMTSCYGQSERNPTVHSLRHTFVVFRMNAWMRDGVDLNVMMPYLCRYLGHSSINETYYYYHQVAEAFSVIRKHDSMSNIVIPEVRIR